MILRHPFKTGDRVQVCEPCPWLGLVATVLHCQRNGNVYIYNEDVDIGFAINCDSVRAWDGPAPSLSLPAAAEPDTGDPEGWEETVWRNV